VGSRIAWSWPDALRGLAYVVPALVVTAGDPERGIPLAVGVLPASLLPLPGPRRARLVALALGLLAGLAILAGGVLAHLPSLLAACLLVGLVVVAAWAASRVAAGMVLLVLAAPLVAVGLSYGEDWSTSVGGALLLAAGATYAWLVSLLWPARPPLDRPSEPLPDQRAMLRYGVLVGAGAALCYLISSALGLDHPGWAPAACLLVARPDRGILELRAVGRVSAVALGAGAALALLGGNPPDVAVALATALAVVGAAATRVSRWYVTSAFTTFLVFLMLVGPDPSLARTELETRLGETVLGVAGALLSGVALPALAARRGRRG
jgi:hypothetical protein